MILYFLGTALAGLYIGYNLPRKDKTRNFFHLIIQKLNIMAENDEKALQDLEAINAQLQKIGNESALSLAKITALEAAANANPGTPQTVLDKIAEVKAQAQIVDDLTPDAETPPA